MLKRRSLGSIPSGVVIALSTLLLLVLTLLLAACSGSTSTSTPAVTATPVQTTTPTQSSKPSGPIGAEWIEAQVNGDVVSIPVSEIESDWNTRFEVQTADGDISAMAYIFNGVIYVRADICPPCMSRSFTLNGNILDCDSCHTKFNASTGVGISGACVNYPKDSVSYTISDGNVLMSIADIMTAYQNTLKLG